MLNSETFTYCSFSIIIIMAAKIQLYMDYISQPSRTVLAFCSLNSIPIEVKQVRIAKLEHLSEEYSKINPMKKVPAIYDPENNLYLGQSHAIVSYLMRKYNLQNNWGHSNESQRAKIDEYLHYHHQNTRKCAAGILYNEVFSKLYPTGNSQVLKNMSLRKELVSVLNFLQRHYFKDSVFLIGGELSVADLSCYFELQSLAVVDYDFSKWNKISKWMWVMGQLKEIQETNSNFLKVLPKMKPKPAPKL